MNGSLAARLPARSNTLLTTSVYTWLGSRSTRGTKLNTCAFTPMAASPVTGPAGPDRRKEKFVALSASLKLSRGTARGSIWTALFEGNRESNTGGSLSAVLNKEEKGAARTRPTRSRGPEPDTPGPCRSPLSTITS